MQLRYLFEAGSGVCLWAHDDEARARYGYAVSLEYLPLSNGSADLGHALISRYDGAIDWSDPGGKPLWTGVEAARFYADSAAFYARLCEELAGHADLHDATAGPSP